MTVREIVPGRVSLLDIPNRLRQMADELEKRPRERFAVVVVVGYLDEGGKVAVRGFGERTSSLETSGWLARAQTMLTEDAGVLDDNWGAPFDPPPAA